MIRIIYVVIYEFSSIIGKFGHVFYELSLFVFFSARFNNTLPPTNIDVAGAQSWNKKSRKAYGISMSLYDQHPVNGKMSGKIVRK